MGSKKSGAYTDWRLYPAINVDHALTVQELLSNDNTTVRQIIDHKHSSLFFEDKREGIKKNLYVPDAKDIDNDNMGSIICRDVSINPYNKNSSYVQAILSITSHGEQLILADDEFARTAILTEILPYYENNIKEILSKLYLHVNHS